MCRGLILVIFQLFAGDEAFWKVAEDALVHALGSKGWKYKVDEGGGAFYGPKIDIKIQVRIIYRFTH